MAKLKLAIVTDIHNGKDSGRRLGSKAPYLTERFVEVANRFEADIAIDMGDRVSGGSKENDERDMTQLRDIFNKLASPFRSLIGNHDIKYLSRAENEEIMGTPSESHSMDIKGFHLTFWNPNVETNGNGSLWLSKEDLQWLKEDLESTDKPTIVFTHAGLENVEAAADGPNIDNTNDIDNRFFYPESKKVRRILEKSGNVIAAFNGHRHKKRIREINGIHYITQQSLTNAYGEEHRATGTYSLIEIEDDKITMNIKGHDRERIELQTKPLKPKNPL